jgi:hypothetical protein
MRTWIEGGSNFMATPLVGLITGTYFLNGSRLEDFCVTLTSALTSAFSWAVALTATRPIAESVNAGTNPRRMPFL